MNTVFLDLLEHKLLSLAFGRADYNFGIQRTETVELSDAITHARCVVSACNQQVLSAKRRYYGRTIHACTDVEIERRDMITEHGQRESCNVPWNRILCDG